jgi:hypothetical protein
MTLVSAATIFLVPDQRPRFLAGLLLGIEDKNAVIVVKGG